MSQPLRKLFVSAWSLASLGSVGAHAPATAAQADLSGPDTPERDPQAAKHLFGGWHGERERLDQHGVSFELLYVSDSLSNIRSQQVERFTSWSRIRGTVSLDLPKLVHCSGCTVELSGIWQTGANMGMYLGTIAPPSALTSANTFRLDSWWIEKRPTPIALRSGLGNGQDWTPMLRSTSVRRFSLNRWAMP